MNDNYCSVKPPYPFDSCYNDIIFDWSTHIRFAVGSDNWPTTWANDDHIYTNWGDGGGFNGTNYTGRVSIGVAKVSGKPENYTGTNILGGVGSENNPNFSGKSYGILALDQVLYMWVSPDDTRTCYFGNRIYFSNDNGKNWNSADWEFPRESGLITPTFLQFGKNYSLARDDFVYIYSIHLTSNNFSKLTTHKPGEIYLLRVNKEHMLNRSKYFFCVGFDKNLRPIWSNDINQKIPVLKNPNGVGWNCSAFFHPGYKKYFLFTEHSKSLQGNISLFVSDNPWGPWTTVYYDCNFGKGHIETTTFYWNVPTKWIKSDNTFTLVFTGTKSNDSWNTVQAKFKFSTQ